MIKKILSEKLFINKSTLILDYAVEYKFKVLNFLKTTQNKKK